MRAFRESRGWDRREMAVRLGLSPKTIQQVELGYQNMGAAARKRFEDMATGAAESCEEHRAEATAAFRPRRIPVDELERIVNRAIEIATDPEQCRKAKEVARVLGCTYVEALQLIAFKTIRDGS